MHRYAVIEMQKHNAAFGTLNESGHWSGVVGMVHRQVKPFLNCDTSARNKACESSSKA